MTNNPVHLVDFFNIVFVLCSYGDGQDGYFFRRLKSAARTANVIQTQLLALVLFFQDLRGNVEKISKFLGKDLSAEKLDAITDHCTFANMKKNPMTNPDNLSVPTRSDPADATPSFMRKGKCMTKIFLE